MSCEENRVRKCNKRQDIWLAFSAGALLESRQRTLFSLRRVWMSVIADHKVEPKQPDAKKEWIAPELKKVCIEEITSHNVAKGTFDGAGKGSKDFDS